MAKFVYSAAKFTESLPRWNEGSVNCSEFDEQLRSSWDKAMEAGFFRYQLDIEDTRIVGEKNYLLQLNIKRAQARRQPDKILTVNQPFNPETFNFTKIKDGEIILELVKDSGSECNGHKGDNSSDTDDIHKVRHLVIINASPLEYGHVLLVPDIDACRPQILTEEALLLSIEMMLLSKHRGFRVGFNSLCAFASVNHQHLHAFYLERELYVETCPVDHLCGPLYELTTMPTHGFAFQLHASTPQQLARTLFLIADYFQKHEVAHNLYMTRGTVFETKDSTKTTTDGADATKDSAESTKDSSKTTVRVYLWPRKKFIGLKDEAAFNVALVELGGHLPIKLRDQFYSLDNKAIEDTIREAALDPTEYNTVKQDVINICSNR